MARCLHLHIHFPFRTRYGYPAATLPWRGPTCKIECISDYFGFCGICRSQAEPRPKNLGNAKNLRAGTNIYIQHVKHRLGLKEILVVGPCTSWADKKVQMSR